jgi:hypothetical protein
MGGGAAAFADGAALVPDALAFATGVSLEVVTELALELFPDAAVLDIKYNAIPSTTMIAPIAPNTM